MKQFIALILALVAAASMAVPAFAETAPTTAVERVAAAPGFSFEKDSEHNAALGDLLTPGESYRFKVIITDENGNSAPLREEHLKNHKFTFQLRKGKAWVKSIDVVNDNDEYFLEIETAAGWPAKQQEVAGEIKYSSKSSSKVLYSHELSFDIGYETISDDALKIADKDEAIVVDPAAPVITTKQFDKLEDIAKGGKLTFTNDDWKFEVKISGQESVNMVHNDLPIKDIAVKYEDANFKFVSFPAGPQFNFTGTFSVNIYDEEDTWENFYVYRYYKGKLNKIDAVRNAEKAELTFNTKELGRFVITDKNIPDGTVIEEGFGGSSNSTSNNASNNTTDSVQQNNNSAGEGKPNPSTGSAAAAAELAMAAAALSAVCGTIVLKRKD